MGAREYLPKPLTRDKVVRLFVPVIVGRADRHQEIDGGRVITVTGARGGVGASTIAVNLAWHFGVARGRHTVLLDPDLHTGTAALYLDALNRPGSARGAGDAGPHRRSVRGARVPGSEGPPARPGGTGTQ